ncbi:hypothetical protein NE237_025457 [Protea cynaroides]|uniref:Uncharacterized protein n=1 Tax=Protea cynaroides TaxID=273540 RepID=A0A9Q0H492_9MAGN|nr:hypothetical protein NE237_025457 [Protea cynaroides]
MDHVTHTERGHSNSEDHELFNPATDTVSAVMKSIQKDLEKVPSWPSNGSIYRVPKTLRTIKPEAFRPRLVSIGPFYRDEEELKPMEAHKLRYLNNILERESRLTLCDYVKAMAELEDRARKCYSEIIQLKSEEFVKMILLDGCFILELILQKTKSHEFKHRPDDPIFNTIWMFRVVRLDLLLLENQLPFFVLERLFNLLGNYSGVGSLTFIELVHSIFGNKLTIPQATIIKSSRLQFRRRKKKDDVDQSRDKRTEIWKDSEGNCKAKHLLDFIRLALLPALPSPSSFTTPQKGRVMMGLHSATELQEAGVKFEKRPTSFLDITFNNGVLKTPTMRITDSTEALFRNLIAYEQCLDENSNEISTYAAFINGLINSPKDVELLQRKGIIVSGLGGPEEVSTLFNNLLKEVNINPNNYFLNVFDEVEKYYKIPRHKRKAIFNIPWDFISVCLQYFSSS